MPDSRRELVLQAVVGALGGPERPAGLTVHRHRTRPLTKEALPAQIVFLDDEDASREAQEGIQRNTRIAVETRAQGTDQEPPDTTTDEFTSWSVKALRADPTLGGLAIDVQEVSTVWGAEEQDRLYARALQVFEIEFWTDEDDPTVEG